MTRNVWFDRSVDTGRSVFVTALKWGLALAAAFFIALIVILYLAF